MDVGRGILAGLAVRYRRRRRRRKKKKRKRRRSEGEDDDGDGEGDSDGDNRSNGELLYGGNPAQLNVFPGVPDQTARRGDLVAALT